MTSPPHHTDTLKRLAGHSDELFRLRERVRDLEGILGIAERPMCIVLPISHTHAQVLSMLYCAQAHCSRDALYTGLYSLRSPVDQPDPKMLDAVICKLRQRIAHRKIFIDTLWGRGWIMRPASKLRLDVWIEECLNQ